MPSKGKSFILYLVVLVVSVTSVVMGLDWLASPPPRVPESVQTVSAPAKPVTPKKTASRETTSTQTAGTTGKTHPTPVAETDAAKSALAKSNAADAAVDTATRQPDVAAAKPETSGSAPTNSPLNAQTNTSADTPDNAVTGEDKTTALAHAGDVSNATAEAPAPRCDVQACEQHYRSFDASDCTFQPFDGPRRLCTVGNPPSQAADRPAGVQTSDASKPSASSACNYDACGAAYRSFDPATCTYQPFEGPRRLCTK